MGFNAHKWIKDFKLSRLNEMDRDRAGKPIKGFVPGDMYRSDFDYVGMLRYSAEMEIPEDLSQLSDPAFLTTLKALSDSYEDVNYHSENADLGNAIEYIEDALKNDNVQKMRMELDRSTDYLESHKKAAAKTLKDFVR